MKIRLFVDSESAAKNIYKYPNINGVRISVNIKDKVIINSYKIIFIVQTMQWRLRSESNRR